MLFMYLLLLLQVMTERKVKFMVVQDSATAWSNHAPYFLFSATGSKEELKAAVHAEAGIQGHASLYLQDDDGDFAFWNEPVPLPASGTICVKVATDSASKLT